MWRSPFADHLYNLNRGSSERHIIRRYHWWDCHAMLCTNLVRPFHCKVSSTAIWADVITIWHATIREPSVHRSRMARCGPFRHAVLCMPRYLNPCLPYQLWSVVQFCVFIWSAPKTVYFTDVKSYYAQCSINHNHGISVRSLHNFALRWFCCG